MNIAVAGTGYVGLSIAVPLAVLFCLGILRGEYISSGFIYQQF